MMAGLIGEVGFFKAGRIPPSPPVVMPSMAAPSASVRVPGDFMDDS
jgi:hypothetical protein